MYILRSIEYKKRSYIFEDGKIIQKSGGLFYDNQNEIIVKNITHVKLMLPFLENKLFETGNIKIEVAGSKKSEIFLQSIENPQEFYKQIRQILQKNGFALKKEKLLIEEFPHKLGVFFETLKAIIGTFFFAMYILFSSEDGGSSLYSVIQGYISLSMIISIIAPVLLVWSIFVYLDLKRRKYDIYNDTLEYTEGFL
jgi:membrane protein YdbS with pleckstrin-like domain